MNKILSYILIIAGALLIAYFAFGVGNNSEQDTASEQQGRFETYRDTEVGIAFTYPTGEDPYLVQDLDFDPADSLPDPHFVKGYQIINEQEYEALMASGVPREGPPTITIMVFENVDNETASTWIDTHPSFSNVGLVVGGVDRDAVFAGAGAVMYTYDGLYTNNTIVAAHDGYIYMISGAFAAEDAPIRTVFAQLINSFEFISSSNTEQAMETSFSLTSTAFESGSAIPSKYTCDGENINPPLTISGVPEGTQSLVLLMDDPDIPQVFKDERGIDAFDHWVVYGIPPETRDIPEGAMVGSEGQNSRGERAYTGPCPPPEYEPTTHRYFFKLYALSGTLNVTASPTLADVAAAMEPMIIAETELMGTYDRSGN